MIKRTTIVIIIILSPWGLGCLDHNHTQLFFKTLLKNCFYILNCFSNLHMNNLINVMNAKFVLLIFSGKGLKKKHVLRFKT